MNLKTQIKNVIIYYDYVYLPFFKDHDREKWTGRNNKKWGNNKEPKILRTRTSHIWAIHENIRDPILYMRVPGVQSENLCLFAFWTQCAFRLHTGFKLFCPNNLLTLFLNRLFFSLSFLSLPSNDIEKTIDQKWDALFL